MSQSQRLPGGNPRKTSVITVCLSIEKVLGSNVGADTIPRQSVCLPRCCIMMLSVSENIQLARSWDMSVGRWWNDTDIKEFKYWEENWFQCHFAHNKSHREWPGIKLQPPCCEADNWLFESRQSLWCVWHTSSESRQSPWCVWHISSESRHSPWCVWHISSESRQSPWCVWHISSESRQSQWCVWHIVWVTAESVVCLTHIVWVTAESVVCLTHIVWVTAESVVCLTHIVWVTAESVVCLTHIIRQP